MDTLAITGATGFLGRHLVAECELRGRYRLKLLTRNPQVSGVAPRSAALCQGDLLDGESLKRFLEPGCTVVHLAYLRGSNAADANLAAAANLASAARQAGVKRVVHCSTAVVVGFAAAGMVTEDTVPAPAGEYRRN